MSAGLERKKMRRGSEKIEKEKRKRIATSTNFRICPDFGTWINSWEKKVGERKNERKRKGKERERERERDGEKRRGERKIRRRERENGEKEDSMMK